MLIIGYLYLGTSLITATAGVSLPIYIGGFVFVIMCPIIAPLTLRFKIGVSTLSIIIFFFVAILTGFDLKNPDTGYISGDLIAPYITSILMSVAYNRIKCETWSQRQELLQAKEDLESFANNDSLTGIHNRRYFMELSKVGIENARRLNENCYIILIDIDKFKNINDTYGHLIGDKILIELATRFKALIRPLDFFARFGGEEFVLFSIHANNDSVQKMAERLRLCLCNLHYEHSGISIGFSASFGVAKIDENDIEKAIKQADDALYRAKREGRNRVIISEYVFEV